MFPQNTCADRNTDAASSLGWFTLWPCGLTAESGGTSLLNCDNEPHSSLPGIHARLCLLLPFSEVPSFLEREMLHHRPWWRW